MPDFFEQAYQDGDEAIVLRATADWRRGVSAAAFARWSGDAGCLT